MAKNINKNRIFRFNRRIRGQTDYNQRLRLLKSNLTRVVVRRSNKNILVQFVNYNDKGDKGDSGEIPGFYVVREFTFISFVTFIPFRSRCQLNSIYLTL